MNVVFAKAVYGQVRNLSANRLRRSGNKVKIPITGMGL